MAVRAIETKAETKTGTKARRQTPKQRVFVEPEGRREASYVDYITLATNGEGPVLSFWQTVYTGVKGSSPEPLETRLVVRLAFSWPHFLRTHAMFERVVNQLRKKGFVG